MKKLKLWLRRNLKLVAGGTAVIALAGCATPATTTTAVSPVTATTTSGVAATTSANAVNKTAFLAWSEACYSYDMAADAALVAIAKGAIKPSAFPTIREVQATVVPLCQTYPSNPTAATAQIMTSLLSLDQTVTENQVAVSPTTSVGVK